MAKNVAVGPWGGESGDSWSFTADSAISRITLTYSDAISSIFIESWRFDEKESKLHTDKFGTPHDGDTKEEIVIDTDTEVLKGISGTIRKLEDGIPVVSSLSFSTTKRELGPFGPFIGQAFAVVVAEDGGVVNGFHGSVGSWINSIGPYLTNDKSLKIKPWGGLGGGLFSYMLKGPISKITITHGDVDRSIIEDVIRSIIPFEKKYVIRSIIFTSKDANGDLHVSPKFGSHDGSNVDKIEIDTAKETINGISGFYDECVTGISFSTTLGNTFGPFGDGWGTPFSLPIKDGAIEGFHGRSGWYVDSIGLYLKPTA